MSRKNVLNTLAAIIILNNIGVSQNPEITGVGQSFENYEYAILNDKGEDAIK